VEEAVEPVTSTLAVRESFARPMPKLPNHMGPWSNRWNNSVAVCAAMRQENATDVREWLLYYKCA
jgi:hypothetical protein